MRMLKRYQPQACSAGGRDGNYHRNLSEPFLDHERKAIVGTDGQVLVSIPVELDSADKGVTYVSGEALDYARRAAYRTQDDINIRAGVSVRPGGQVFPITDMRYEEPPPYRQAFEPRAIPDEKTRREEANSRFRTPRAVSVNLELLNKAARALGTKCVILVVDGDMDPITVYPEERHWLEKADHRAVALVMPRRF